MKVEQLIKKLSAVEDKEAEVYIGCDSNFGYCLCVNDRDRTVIFHDGQREDDNGEEGHKNV